MIGLGLGLGLTIGSVHGPLRSLGVRAQSRPSLTQFEHWLGKSVGHVMVFCDSSTWAASLTRTTDGVTGWGASGKRLEWVFPLCTTTENLAATIAGTHDATITSMFTAIANGDLKSEIWIRLGWEMNLPNSSGYPWSAVDYGNTNYINAFRHVVGIARAISSRFKFTWAPNWAAANPEPMYPGDAYVDVIGMDAYFKTQYEQNSGQNGTQVWAYKLNALYGLTWLADFGRAHNKPIALCEWGGNADVPEYMTGQTAWIKSNNVKYHGYWDQTTPTAANCKLSNTQYPNMGAIYRAAFGRPGLVRAWTPMLAFGTDLVEWFDASDFGAMTVDTGLSRWMAETGEGKNLYQGNTANQPLYNATARNGLPGVTFDGSNNYLAQTVVTGVPGANQAVAIAGQLYGSPSLAAFKYFLSIADATSSYSVGAGSSGYIRFQNGGNFLQSPTLIGFDRSFVLSAPAGGTVNMTGGLDGDQAPKTASIVRSNITTPTRLIMGGEGQAGTTVGSFAPITMQEIMVFKRALTTDETNKLHGYLAHKWKGNRGAVALPGGHPYFSGPPTL